MAAIKVHNVHKKFKVYYDKSQSFKEKLLFRNRNYYEERWVLKGVDFTVEKGEAVGIIGENGSGKSTLLKLMTKIMYPDQGNLEMQGRISSLIELGAGFHPDMSGRENIYTNASIFGLTRSEIDQRIQDIIAFSELEEFIDNPVRTYSSGMYMRLAFSVAIHVDADILLIDEILAVGDASFQAKCFNKLREIKNQGVTIIIVSHALGQIEQFCERSIWIDNGLVRAQGVPREVHPSYLDTLMNQGEAPVDHFGNDIDSIQNQEEDALLVSLDESNPELVKEKELGNKKVFISKVKINNMDSTSDKFFMGHSMQIDIFYRRYDSSIQDVVCGIHIYRSDGLDCYGTNTWIDSNFKIPIQGNGMITLVLKKILLLPGVYTCDLAVHDEFGKTYHHIFDAFEFEIYNTLAEVGLVRIEHEWKY